MRKKNIIYMLIVGILLAGLSVYSAFGYEDAGYYIKNFCQIFISVVALVICMCLVEKIKTYATKTFNKWICNVSHIALLLVWGYAYNLMVYSHDDPISLSTYLIFAIIVLVISALICLIYMQLKKREKK